MTCRHPRAVLHRLDRLAARQHGVATGSQLASLGYGPEAVAWLLHSGRVAPVRRGVYRLCGASVTWRTPLVAAALAAGAGAVVSHRSAAVMWGLIDRHQSGGPLELTASRRLRLAGVRAHRHRLDPDEVTVRAGIAVTVVERTLLDLAESTDRVTLGRVVDEALRRGLTDIRRLWRVAGRHDRRGRRRRGNFWAVMADRGLGYSAGDSDFERRMDRMWDRLGLPAAERQFRIRVAGGRSFRPDRAIVDARIAIDWNGFGPHGTRSSFDADSDRRARLAEAGWYPLDFTSRSDPALICRTVMAVYRERIAALGLAPPDLPGEPAPPRRSRPVG